MWNVLVPHKICIALHFVRLSSSFDAAINKFSLDIYT